MIFRFQRRPGGWFRSTMWVGFASIGATRLAAHLLLAANSVFAADPVVHGEHATGGPPRRMAVLMDGCGTVNFQAETQNGLAAKYFDQGLAQLHGFWYLEAERSFLSAAAEDSQMAIAYWGVAMANREKAAAAREAIDEAKKRLGDKTPDRERRLVQAADRWLLTEKEIEDREAEDERQKTLGKKALANSKEKRRETDKRRWRRYLDDLESLALDFPDDIELKSILVRDLWAANGAGVPIQSHLAIDAILDQIFKVAPDHPAHHFRIHLWDHKRPAMAEASAHACGPAAPAIAHMWHMPGHIFWRLKRYDDAAWQQEASARVDHQWLHQSGRLPAEIHNFAHNNEWLTRSLIRVGRVGDAVALAKNLISMPRHPELNSIDRRGTYSYGRDRLIDVLTAYELWDRLEAELGGPYLDPTEHPQAADRYRAAIAVARARGGIANESKERTEADLAAAGKLLKAMRLKRIDRLKEKIQAPAGEAKRELEGQLKSADRQIAWVRAAIASRNDQPDEVGQHAKKAGLDVATTSLWMADAGDLEGGIKKLQAAMKNDGTRVRYRAILADLLIRADREDEALEHLTVLRTLAGNADLETPMLAKLKPAMVRAGFPDDWRTPKDADRPRTLDSLGPLTWSPPKMPAWGAKDATGKAVFGEEFRGRPTLILFYLGAGCLHCVEQLHAFNDQVDRFKSAGIDVIAISTEDVETLRSGLDDYEKKLEIPLLSRGDDDIFEAFGCWDEFSGEALHGTFFVTADGKMRFWDIGAEPMMDVDFVLAEAKRQMAIGSTQVQKIALAE
ncbi:MAG: peroxiredoxin family protein [Planctomycetota bacterium]